MEPRPIVPEPGGNPEIDVVFPVLHGTFGEDGTVQGLLELAELPYVGAGVLASAVSMDKEVMKRLMAGKNLPIVDYRLFTGDAAALDGLCRGLPFPVFVKPANLGSSVGISKAHDCAELKTAVEFASGFDRKVLIERGIAGREFECSVMGNESPVAAIPCEILPSKEFYDYEDKYLLGKTRTDFARAAHGGANRPDAPPGGGMLPSRLLRGDGACRFSDGGRHRNHLHQRDQHHSRLHFHQHVS